MTADEFRSAMNAASRDGSLCFLMHGDKEVVALGLDSGRGVAFLFEPGGKYEVPLSELREGFE